MKPIKCFAFTVMLFISSMAIGQQASGSFEKWKYLIGEWVGEGNTIKYKVTLAENSIILTSEKSAGSPRFRLTYTMTNESSVTITFDMASPDSPEAFRTYLTGKAVKVK